MLNLLTKLAIASVHQLMGVRGVFLKTLLLLSGSLLAADKTVRVRWARALPSWSGSSMELDLPEALRPGVKLTIVDDDLGATPLPSIGDILTVLARDTGAGSAASTPSDGAAAPDRSTSPVRLRQLATYLERYRQAKVPLPKQSPYNSSFAIYAAHTNQPAALELLAHAGEDLTQIDQVGRSPLVAAATQGHVAVIERLAMLGVPATSAALAAAVEHSQPAAVRALLAQKTVVATPALLQQARQRGQSEIAALLAAATLGR